MKSIITENINQINDLLQKLPAEKYVQKIEVLSGSTIGQHIRHILEFYSALVNSNLGTISYDNRERDSLIENNIEKASSVIQKIITATTNINEEEPLKYEASFSTNKEIKHFIESSVGREMAYCIEHSIHHQALIKAALIELKLQHLVDANFGVAYSTIQHKKKTCAQ